MRRLLILAALLAALGLAAACGSGGNGDGAGNGGETDGDELTPSISGEIVPIPVNSELVAGPNRFAIGLVDEEKEPIQERPGTIVSFRFVGPDGAQLQEQVARFVWVIPDVKGFWAADVDFPEAGDWKLEILLTRNGEETETSYTFSVWEESEIPNVGDPAPPTQNLTLADVPDIKQISTDEEPEPALYQMTVAEALEAGRPLLVVFATPAFCQTAFCGPIVDNVKEVRQEFADQVNFIHIEPFVLDNEGRLVEGPGGGPIRADPTSEWRLQTEPWTFIVDAQGRIAARFEGTASPDELRQAIQQTLRGR